MHGFGDMSGLFLLAAAATLHPPPLPPCEVMSIIDKDTIIANDVKASMVLGVANCTRGKWREINGAYYYYWRYE